MMKVWSSPKKLYLYFYLWFCDWQLIKSHFGENHPVYACGLNNLALMYKSMEDYDEAAIYYDKALQIYEDVRSKNPNNVQTCGKNHKSTLTTLKNLAILYQARADAEGVSCVFDV